MVRKVTFRGKNAEELQKLSIQEFAKLLKSRPRRAVLRMSASYKELIAKVEEAKKAGDKSIKTQVREAVILPSWIGMTISVHNGKVYQDLAINTEHIGHRLGDFAFTTKHVQHSAPGIR